MRQSMEKSTKDQNRYHVMCGLFWTSFSMSSSRYSMPAAPRRRMSLRISADIIVQSVAQLKEMYDDKQGKIMSNCSITILLGANDLDDCKLFSELIGQTTVQSESINIDRKGIVQGSNGGSLSDNAESLLRPENIRTMPKDECLIIVNTSNPIRDKKYKHP